MTEKQEIILQVGVKAFLRNKGGKFLLVRRSKEKYKDTKGNWDIVGGRINPGSSLFDNLKREIQEEVSLVLKERPKLIAAQDILRVPGKHIVRLTYSACIEGEPVLDTTENVEYKWMNIEEMKKEGDLDIFVKEILESGALK